jgi:hypothetical protein
MTSLRVTKRIPIPSAESKPSSPTPEKEKQNPIPFKVMGSKFNACPYPPHGLRIVPHGLTAWRKEYKFIMEMSRRIKKNKKCFSYDAA